MQPDRSIAPGDWYRDRIMVLNPLCARAFHSLTRSTLNCRKRPRVRNRARSRAPMFLFHRYNLLKNCMTSGVSQLMGPTILRRSTPCRSMI